MRSTRSTATTAATSGARPSSSSGASTAQHRRPSMASSGIGTTLNSARSALASLAIGNTSNTTTSANNNNTTFTPPSLHSFCIFNRTWEVVRGGGASENKQTELDGELEQILLFHPASIPANDQLKQIGVAQALMSFSKNFGTDPEAVRCKSVHSQKHRWTLLEPEPDYWMLLNMNLACTVQILRSGQRVAEYSEGSVDDETMKAILESAYQCFRLLYGTFEHVLKSKQRSVLRKLMESHFVRYFDAIPFHRPFDFVKTLHGMPYLPLEKSPYMDLFSLMQKLKGRPDNCIDQFLVLYENSVLWTDLDHADTQHIHYYLTEIFGIHVLPELAAVSASALQTAGKMKREHGSNIPVPSARRKDGFLTVPTSISGGAAIEPLLFYLGQDCIAYHIVLFRMGKCILGMLVRKGEGSAEDLENPFYYESIDATLRQDLAPIVQTIEKLTHAKQKSSGAKQSHYIYYNRVTMEVRTRGEFANRSAQWSLEVTNCLNEFRRNWKTSVEIMIKTAGDLWIAAKRFEDFDLYVILQKQRDSSIVDVEKEIMAICESDFKEHTLSPNLSPR